MIEEQNFSEKESLELITSMINKAKNRFVENGFLYILWGWVILICSIIQFISLYFFNSEKGYYIWFLSWGLLIFQINYLRKKRKTRTEITYTSEIGEFVWVVFVVCIFLLIFVLIKLGAGNAINPAILVMYGMATVLLGYILQFKPLIFGGIICWALSVLAVFVLNEFQSLLIVPAVIAAWLIPGYLLQKKYKKYTVSS
jgi:hypothetical protein